MPVRKTKNITVCVSVQAHYHARVWAARHHMSLSSAIKCLLENLPAVSEAFRRLLAENPNFGREDPVPPRQKPPQP